MSRADFNATCTVYRGDDETKIDVPFAVGVPCRLISQDGIFAYGDNSLPIDYYLTVDSIIPVGSWDEEGGLEVELGDWILLDEPGAQFFTVVYVKFVDWKLEPDYFQAHLVPFRRVRRIASGGVLIGGVAVVDVHQASILPVVGTGGILLGGTGVIQFHPATSISIVGTGGVLLGGAAALALVRSFPAVTGGVVIGGEADITTTAGPTVGWHDTFTDTNGVALTSHTGETTPGGYTANNGVHEIQSNRAAVRTYTTGSAQTYFDPGQTVYTVSVDFLIAPISVDNVSRFFSYKVRWNGNTNNCQVRAQWVAGSDTATAWELCKTVGGVLTVLATGPAGLTADTVHTLTIVDDGLNIWADVDGSNVNVNVTEHAGNTQHMIQNNGTTPNTAKPYWENLLVTNP